MSVEKSTLVSKSAKSKSKTSAPKTSKSAAKAKPGKTKKPRGDRSKRLLDLVMLLLRARTPVTFRAIRDQFTSYQTENVEAGLRAFERDKADLLELGVPIRYVTPEEDDAIDEGGYVIDLKKFRLPEVHLTSEEISALVLAASIARAVPGVSYAKVVDLAVRKLSFDYPEPDTPLEWPPPEDQVEGHEPVLVHFPESPAKEQRELSDRFSSLEAATRNRKRVTMSYRTASTGYLQTRDVDPYGLVYRDGAWLLVGYCHLREDVRSFRLDRIADLKIAPKPKSPDFERPEDFDVRSYASRSPWTFTTEAPEEVELEIRPDAAATANEDFGPDAEREVDGASTVVRFECGNPSFLISRVLAAKGALVIRRGERVKQLLADELEAVRRMYQ